MQLDESAEDEIRRFEEQFRHQPESLVFARLADAHRKAGDPHRALEVLEEGIRRHTDYLSAHIVRARTYRDLGRSEDAKSAFERVIEIDAQNLVAIQGLAEIAREADDTNAEISWLERLALADPQNEDPGERLELLRQLESASEGETWWTEESGSAGVSEAVENPPAESDLTSELWSGPANVLKPEPVEGPEADPVDGSDLVEAAADTEEEWEGSYEVLADPFEDLDLEETAPLDPSSPTEPAAKEPWWFEPPPGHATTQHGGGEMDDAESEDDADLLTRTMAELYARQGLIDEAEAIYRELIRDRPDDEGLRDGLDAVLGMRAARSASRASDVTTVAEHVEEPEAEVVTGSTGPEPTPAAESLKDLLRAGEALAHRLPEPPPPVAATDDEELEEEDSAVSGSVIEPPVARPVLEEWLRGLRS